MRKQERLAGAQIIPVILTPDEGDSSVSRAGFIDAVSADWIQVRFTPGQCGVFGNKQGWRAGMTLPDRSTVAITLETASVMEHHAAVVVRFHVDEAWSVAYPFVSQMFEAAAPLRATG